ncbi:MAG: OmpH family outer membrane protein [Aeromonadales bacterium]|nr:OmpH family outer membrane protein [Aeromonadales bacterium]MDY2891494.1 OmpH family outer membrane protein [Succinivibrio sp.]
MANKFAIAAALAAAVIAPAAFGADSAPAQNGAAAASSFIGVVNVPLIMNDIPQAAASKEKLQKQFGPRAAELQKLETDGKALQQQLPTLKGDQQVEAQRKLAQMQADYNLKARALQEDQGKAVHDEEMKLGRLVQEAIDNIAKERGLQLVIRGEAVAYATRAVDISDEVISRVSKQAGAAAPAGSKKPAKGDK